MFFLSVVAWSYYAYFVAVVLNAMAPSPAEQVPIPIIISRGGTEDIISYFTLMSSEIHYYDIIEKMGSWTLMSSEV